ALEANQDLLRALLEEPARRLLAEALRILEPALAASACHALAVRRRDERAQAKPSFVPPFGIGGERDDAASAQRAAHRSFGAHARGRPFVCQRADEVDDLRPVRAAFDAEGALPGR